MKFLFVGSQVCRWASFRRSLAESPLPLASRCCFIPFMDEPRFFDRGLAPHQFTPMLGVHHPLQRTALRAVAELGRWASRK
jgi:hypothetical protein